MAICKFGASVTFLNEFNSSPSDELGPLMLQELNFDQSKTDLMNLLNVVGDRLIASQSESKFHNQMLIIIGDGRGLLSGSLEKTRDAIHRLMDKEITIFFIIVDNGPKSIIDTTIAEFEGDHVKLTPYMSKFPFPFYALVRHINVLPATIAEVSLFLL